MGNNGADTYYSGVLCGSGSLTKVGSGVLVLSGINTYTGDTILSGGTLIADMLWSSTLDMEGGTWSPISSQPWIGGLKGSGDLSLPNTGCLYVGSNNQSTAYSGVLSGPTQLQKMGSGTLTFSGANTYTGDTLVYQGTLNLANQNAIQNSTFAGGGGVLTFDPGVSSYAFTIGGLSGVSNLILQDGPNGTGNPVALSVGNDTCEHYLLW